MQQASNQKRNTQQHFDLNALLQDYKEQRIVSIPLEFSYLPVDILSKQFTKLNSPHPYRIHYLGPRYPNSHTLHKKLSNTGNYDPDAITPLTNIIDFKRYDINMRKIVQSNFITENMKNNHYYKSGIYYRAFEGMNPTLDKSKEYIFNSAFQAGNLDCVIKVNPNEFDLFLRIDSNTRGHIQWFYFSVKNGAKIGKVKLNLCNISKGGTLYQNGMKPYIFSKVKFQKQSKFWQQGSQNIQFGQKQLRYDVIYERTNQAKTYYCLSFDYFFQFENDQVFFAYCIPYTYSQLLKELQLLPKQFKKQYSLGRTLSGVDIPILHITDHYTPSIKRKNILITARIHPGESNGSYVLSGFLKFLCSQTKQAKQLRDRINFIVIPMINPDGVIMGNSRTSASGKDLNRQYKTFNSQLYPQVCLVKSLVSKIKKKYGNLLFYFDFHGHSRKKNTFFYGPSYALSESEYYKCRILPRMIQKIINTFRYYSCSFMISQQKKSTARAVFLQQYRIPYTYTIQSSIGFYYDSQEKNTFQFTQQAWEDMGLSICKGFSQFIISYEDFQQYVNQRRKQRKKAKQRKQQKKGKKFAQDQQQQKAFYKSSMLEMIEQIKSMPVPKIVQQQCSSDDHDANQDMQISKFAQFNKMVNGKKDKPLNASKKVELPNFENIQKKRKSQNSDCEINLINEHCGQKKQRQTNIYLDRNAEKKPKSHNIVKRNFIVSNRNSQSYLKSKEFLGPVKKQKLKPKTQKVIIPGLKKIQSKKFLLPQGNFSKCLVIARQFLPSERQQFQALDIPIKFQSSCRRDYKYPSHESATRYKYQNKSNAKRSNLFKNKQISKQYQNILQTDRNPRSSQHELVRIPKKQPMHQSSIYGTKTYNQLPNPKTNLKQHFIFSEGFELDNLAMTIRTFNK